MNVLMLGLYAEGRSDERFLPVLIQRTCERILAQFDRFSIEANIPAVIKIKRHNTQLSRAERILAAAYESFGYHALIVHADADDLTPSQARNERFDPGNSLIQRQKPEEKVCKNLIPIVPVCMVEAWMLADPEALNQVLKVSIDKASLGLSGKSKQVELYRDPKDIIDQIVRRTYPDRSREWNRIRGILYEDLAPLVSFERLDQVPSYKQFVKDLTETLKILNLIQYPL